MHLSRRVLVPTLLACLLTLVGCAAGGDVTKPVPTTFIAAPQPAQRLVVMLPGRGDSLQKLTETGIAEIIQQSWPDADVLLTGLTMPFYQQGRAVQRLHDEVIEPARRKGYGQVWLAGISLGGMGTLLYDSEYPDQIDGLLLLSPYLGEDAIHQQIRQAGGLAAWQAGPARTKGPDTFQHELWRSLQGWSGRPKRAGSTWVAVGADEPFRHPVELITPLLPADHVIILPGKHNWKLWKPAMRALLERTESGDGESRPAPTVEP